MVCATFFPCLFGKSASGTPNETVHEPPALHVVAELCLMSSATCMDGAYAQPEGASIEASRHYGRFCDVSYTRMTRKHLSYAQNLKSCSIGKLTGSYVRYQDTPNDLSRTRRTTQQAVCWNGGVHSACTARMSSITVQRV